MINAEEFYKKNMADDLLGLEDVDDVFGVIEMMVKNIGSAHTVLEDLEDALEETEVRAGDVPSKRQVRHMPKKNRTVF